MRSAGPGPAATLAILVAYGVVFWLLLPVGLWAAAVRIDQAWEFVLAPTALGALPALWGASLMLDGMWALRRRGRGWPVTALPPPLLVTGGLYRVVRHPIYLGFNLVIFGVGLMVGSAGLALVIAPLLLPAWIAYALLEERGLRARFGSDYARYTRQVGLLPAPSLRPLLTVFRVIGVLRVRVLEGAEHIPADGPVILVSNHTCYADPVWLALTTRRRVWMIATAEAYRHRGLIGTATRMWPAIPVRRYRVDPAAARQMVDLLRAGEVVGMFCERERSVLGRYLGTEPAVAAVLPRLGVPVVPVGIQGGYTTGPRWSGSLRIPTMHARIGPPIDWSDGLPHEVLDRRIRALLDEDPQRVDLGRERLDRLHRAVWRCPRCLDEAGWRPCELACSACGVRWQPTRSGQVRGPEGVVQTFAEWARPVWEAAEALPFEVQVHVRCEPDPLGPILPLEDRGPATLRVDADGLSWGASHLPHARVLSTSTERADTLQIATSDAMWQFQTERSPFRLRQLVDRLRLASPAVPPLHTRRSGTVGLP